MLDRGSRSRERRVPTISLTFAQWVLRVGWVETTASLATTPMVSGKPRALWVALMTQTAVVAGVRAMAGPVHEVQALPVHWTRVRRRTTRPPESPEERGLMASTT
ncbi:hypothetical protein D3C86_1431720 [compost metagenome]